LFGAALAAGLPACGSSDESPGGAAGAHASGGSGVGGSGAAAGTPSVGGAGAGGAAPAAGDATKGAAVWTNQGGCAVCHGDNAAGGLGSNITPSKTAGIGNWTLAQFTNAVRNGKDNEGKDLCVGMTRFTAAMINDAQMADLFAYVQTKPVSDVPVVKPGLCP